jgi:DNA-directed RNA polymerase
MEVKVEKNKKSIQQWQVSVMKTVLKTNPSNKSRLLLKLKPFLAETDEWKSKGHAIIGAELIRLLIRTAFFGEEGNQKHAFIHRNVFNPKTGTSNGYVQMDENVFKNMTLGEVYSMPRYLPMLVAPRPWNNKVNTASCFLRLQCGLVRTFSRTQSSAVARANMDRLMDCVNYLGTIGWRINDKVYDAVVTCWEQGILVGELPSKVQHSPPSENDAIRLPFKPDLSKLTRRKNMSQTAYESQVQRYKDILEAHPDDNDPYWSTPAFDERYYQQLSKHVGMKNADLKSLRCDLELKLSIAKRYLDQKFFFPYNIDFRGRAYPVPPNLNHIGSDMCRGLLVFDVALPLGPNGLRWLKIHLCNLFGNNKISMDDREKWTNANMEKIRASAMHPLNEENPDGRWWMNGEKPFEILAACIEIVKAVDSGDPASYKCALPVHQDGSCNGLQHYAALGCDAAGGAAVNLCPSDRPQDVYSKVLEIVNRKIDEDALINVEHADVTMRRRGNMARTLQGVVDRKVIKQSVMTSVYGVTRRGATMQVFARLQEKLIADGDISMDKDREIMPFAMYVAGLTLDSLGELFNSAYVIMKWLGECARIVASQGQSMSWISPLGLPIIQPYRRIHVQQVDTLLQTISLSVNNDALPVSPRKQQSAFPPNFVHSLDATHMALTALKMKERGLIFASVHDSYWTHACNVDTMNEVRCLTFKFIIHFYISSVGVKRLLR